MLDVWKEFRLYVLPWVFVFMAFGIVVWQSERRATERQEAFDRLTNDVAAINYTLATQGYVAPPTQETKLLSEGFVSP